MDSSTLAQPAVPLCLFQSTLGFVLVGSAWGLTTPFIRRAAVKFSTKPHASLNNPANSWLKNQILKATFMVLDLLRTPAYALPLVINLTGSIWFFLLVGKAGKLSCCDSSNTKYFELVVSMKALECCGTERGDHMRRDIC